MILEAMKASSSFSIPPYGCSRESRAENREPRVESLESRIDIRESRVEIRESRVEIRESRIEIRESRFERRESRIENRDSRIETLINSEFCISVFCINSEFCFCPFLLFPSLFLSICFCSDNLCFFFFSVSAFSLFFCNFFFLLQGDTAGPGHTCIRASQSC